MCEISILWSIKHYRHMLQKKNKFWKKLSFIVNRKIQYYMNLPSLPKFNLVKISAEHQQTNISKCFLEIQRTLNRQNNFANE